MSIIHISENAYPELIEYLRENGHEVRITENDARLGKGVGDHADLRVCVIGKKAIFADISGLEPKYPENAAYCAVVLDDFFVHRLDITAPEILDAAKDCGKTLINVRQGYTRCSCAVIDGNSIITADEGIAKTLEKYPEIDVLKISEGNVLLPGFDYGFIGGTMGRVENEILFNGDISQHPDYDKIRGFIEKRGLKLRTFGGNLRDIGSIIEERTEK